MITDGRAPDTDFQRALQAACDEGRVLELHSPLTLSTPVAIKLNVSQQGWFGLDGNLNRITSSVKDGPALRFYIDDVVPKGTCARAMMLSNFSMIGGGGGLQLDIPFNDRWLGNLELRSLWFEGCAGSRVLRCVDLSGFGIFDLDAYGSPWLQAAIIAAHRAVKPGELIGFCLTEGSNLKLKMGDAPKALAVLVGLQPRAVGLASSQDELVSRSIGGLCRRMKCRLVRAWRAKGKSAARVPEGLPLDERE